MFEKRFRKGIAPKSLLATCIVCLFGCTSCAQKSKTPKLSTPQDVAKTKVDMQEVADNQIAKKIENNLEKDAAVNAAAISVTVEDGIATLKGKQSSYTAKHRAALIAETVRKVRAVVNRIEVVPDAALSDGDIEQSIVRSLALSPTTESFEIDVSVNNGIATLTGTVDSWQEQALAEQLTANVRGVKGFISAISVEHDAQRPDYEIKQDIQAAFKWDSLLHDEKIKISVENGKVTLEGVVPSAAEKRLAVWDAQVAGVNSVVADKLDVNFWDATDSKYKQATLDDSEINQAVEDAMLFDPRVNSMKVQTRVEDGIVYLRGTVDNLMAKRAAENDAENTTGVIYVNNLLKVRPTKAVEDEDIRAKVEQSIMIDPYIPPNKVKVSVKDGAVRLEGMVDSLFEKARAEIVAGRVSGATKIINTLDTKNLQGVLVFDPYLADVYTISYFWVDTIPEGPSMSDKQIAENIRDEMWWSPFVTEDEVDVSVASGVAKLEGTVDSWSERRAAVRAAFEGGAQRVVNNLSVAGG